MILKNAGINYSFPEALLSELVVFNQKITSIPDSPAWVLGVFNYDNDSLIMLDLSVLFGIRRSEEHTSELQSH